MFLEVHRRYMNIETENLNREVKELRLKTKCKEIKNQKAE